MELRERIRATGLKATKGRCLVLSIVLEADAPVTHAEVHARSNLERAVVYRTLVDLAEAELLTRSNVDGVWRFEGPHDQGHPHFVCEDCGVVTCLPDAAVSVRATQGAPKAMRTKSLSIRIRGTCDSCA